jgi:hypothetical protein
MRQTTQPHAPVLPSVLRETMEALDTYRTMAEFALGTVYVSGEENLAVTLQAEAAAACAMRAQLARTLRKAGFTW